MRKQEGLSVLPSFATPSNRGLARASQIGRLHLVKIKIKMKTEALKKAVDEIKSAQNSMQSALYDAVDSGDQFAELYLRLILTDLTALMVKSVMALDAANDK